MKRQRAKGKRQNMACDALTREAAQVAAPAASPLPVSKPLDAASPQESDHSIDASPEPDDSASATEKTVTPQKPSISYDRAMRLLEQRGSLMVATIAAVLSIVSFVYFFTNGMTNHYGDGIAHVNIARKVVDSPDSSLW